MVPAYLGCPGQTAVKWLLLLLIVSCVSLFVKWCEFGLCIVSVSLAKVGDFKTEKPARNLTNAEHKVTLNFPL